jgi:hypothetical protein
MRIPTVLPAALVAFLILPFAALTHENGVHVTDAYARFMPGGKSGAAFMVIENHQSEDDRLVAALSRVAERVELHTHVEGADGMMQMIEVPEGFAIPAGGSHVLERGGDHMMFLGIIEAPAEGGTVPVTLVFEKAGEITLDIPVDNARQGKMTDGQMSGGGHGKMQHGAAPSN